ncbi:hypothetical protein ACN47E_008415 [Coniothyrium glycines]
MQKLILVDVTMASRKRKQEAPKPPGEAKKKSEDSTDIQNSFKYTNVVFKQGFHHHMQEIMDEIRGYGYEIVHTMEDLIGFGFMHPADAIVPLQTYENNGWIEVTTFELGNDVRRCTC